MAEVESLMPRADGKCNLDYRDVGSRFEIAVDLSNHIRASTADELVIAEFWASLTTGQRSVAVGDNSWVRCVITSADIVGGR